MQMNRRGAALLLAAFAVARPALGADTDHPLLSRMAGFTIRDKTVTPFDAVAPSFVGEPLPDVATSFQGKVTRIDYISEKPAGEVAIYRNYAAAVQRAGGHALNRGFDADDKVTHCTGAHVFALAAGAQAPVALLEITHGAAYRLTIVEPQAMEQTVTAGQLADEIRQQGRATLYINFDTGKSALPPDGQAAVKEIAALLKGDSSLRLSIDGHTDNAGQAAANRKLSGQRAASVRDAVVAQGIPAARLQARGYGQDVPVADNRTEAGRAKNRRVELVKLK